MKSCAWCGRENAEIAVHCEGCGTELNPPRAEDIDGVLEAAAPLRRCRCGEDMAFYSPEKRCSTFTRAFKFRYWCPVCDARPLVPTDAQMRRYALYLLGGTIALGWLLFSETARQFDHSRDANRAVVFAIVYLAVGIGSGYLLFIGCLNRVRYPLVRELPKSPAREGAGGAGRAVNGLSRADRGPNPGLGQNP